MCSFFFYPQHKNTCNHFLRLYCFCTLNKCLVLRPPVLEPLKMPRWDAAETLPCKDDKLDGRPCRNDWRTQLFVLQTALPSCVGLKRRNKVIILLTFIGFDKMSDPCLVQLSSPPSYIHIFKSKPYTLHKVQSVKIIDQCPRQLVNLKPPSGPASSSPLQIVRIA